MNQEQTNITTGKQIRHLRTQSGMTQEELAGELNVTRQALSNWERDVNECSKYREVKAIVDDWMDYYNNSRYQWQLAKLSPNEYYEYITTGIYPLEGIVSCKVDKQTFPRTNK